MIELFFKRLMTQTTIRLFLKAEEVGRNIAKIYGITQMVVVLTIKEISYIG